MTQIKNEITVSVGVSVKIQKNIVCVKKDYIWNPATSSCENGKYVRSIIDDSVITGDEIIKETKTDPAKSTSTKTFLTKCASTNFYILLAYLLIN